MEIIVDYAVAIIVASVRQFGSVRIDGWSPVIAIGPTIAAIADAAVDEAVAIGVAVVA
ncbi:MAG: hypothetical protein IPH50_03815 [Rhodanobacteraceae bacterium]|nr:hypothetical protein [Rhodanobacteraceae bacterium]